MEKEDGKRRSRRWRTEARAESVITDERASPFSRALSCYSSFTYAKKDLKKKRKKGCERDALLKWNRVNGAQCSPQFVQKYFIGEELYNEGKCKKEKI